MDERASNAVQAEDREARVFQEVARIPLRLVGAPIWVRFLPDLTAHRGRLLSNAVAGQPVFAGSFLRQREMVLDAALLNDDQERARILVHELFHFVWLRLGNSDRAGWTTVVDGELAARARGELGWSSEWRKRELPRQVREYVCESFCDTAAWMYSGVERHEEFTLSLRWRMRRREWFRRALGGRQVVKI